MVIAVLQTVEVMTGNWPALCKDWNSRPVTGNTDSTVIDAS